MSFLDEVRAASARSLPMFLLTKSIQASARSLMSSTRIERTSSTNCSRTPKMQVPQTRTFDTTMTDSVAFEHNGRSLQ